MRFCDMRFLHIYETRWPPVPCSGMPKAELDEVDPGGFASSCQAKFKRPTTTTI